MTSPSLHLRIVSPQKLLYEAEVQSVSSTNSSGRFDILPQHANFITIAQNSPITVRIKGQRPVVFNFPIAIFSVSANRVNIYTYGPS